MQILLERGLGFYDLKIALKTNSFCCLLSFAGLFFCFFFVFIEFVTILLLFYVLVFWPQVCGILVP